MSTRAAFSRALDILFENMGHRALYKGLDAPEAKEVLVVYRMPDTTLDVQDSFIASPSNVIEVRVSDVAAPKAGDSLTFEQRTFLLQGEAERDQHGLYWKLNVVER